MIIDSSAIQSYIDCLKKESLKNDFCGLNCYLIQKSDGLEKKNLLITLKARRELPVFLYSILDYCQQRYEYIEKNQQIAQINDLVYYSEKVWRIIKIREEQATVQELIEKKTENVWLSNLITIAPKDCSFQQSQKIKIDFSDTNLKIISYYESYYRWSNLVKDKYSGFLKHDKIEKHNKINSRILIISPDNGYFKKILNDIPHIPFTCENRSSASCTSYYHVADIYKIFDIPNGIQLINKEYNEIFIIGDNNIRKHLSDLIGLVDRGIIDRFVLIGTEKPETNFPLTEWTWTKEEYNAWCNKPISGKIRLKITGEIVWNGKSNGVEELKTLVYEIIDITQSIRQNFYNIRLDYIYYFINEYLRYILPPDHQCLSEINKKTNDFLNGDDFKNAFYEITVFDQGIIKSWCDKLTNAFNQLNLFFIKINPKFNHIQCSLKSLEDFERFNGGRYVLAARDILEECQRTNELHNPQYHIGSIPLFDSHNKSFDQIVDSDLNTSNAQYIFPFIFNRAQLETMLECNGDVKLFLYEGIEDFKYVKVLEAHQRHFLFKIQHPDRKLFFDSEYLVMEKPVQELSIESKEHSDNFKETLFKEFDKLEKGKKDFFEQLYCLDDLDYQSREYQSQDKTEYEITFEDEETFVLPGFRRIILVEKLDPDKERYLEVPLGAVQKGQTIIVYRNQNKHLIYDILKEQDNSGLIQEIEKTSNLWFSSIREIQRKIGSDYSVLEQLFANKGIKLTYPTLHGYLQHDRKFPQEIETIEAIRQIAVEKGLSDSYLKTTLQMENILKRKKQYHSITITLGRGISDEIIRHFLTGEKGDLLEKLDPDIFEVLKLNVKQGKVKFINKKQ